MRTFIASLALLLAGLVGTAALTCFVLSQTVLDRERPGQVIDAVIGDDDRRAELVEELAQLGGADTRQARRQIDRVLQDPEVRERVRELRRAGNGAVDVSELRDEIQAELERRGQNRAAAAVGQGDSQLGLPGDFAEDFDRFGRIADFVATAGAAVSAGLIGLALLVGSNRSRIAKAAGITVLFTVGGTLALFYAVPWLITQVSDSEVLQVAADATRAARTDVVPPLVVVALIGVALIAVGAFWPSSHRY